MHSADQLNTPNINRYPAQIVLSARAEAYLSALADALVLGQVDMQQLPQSLRDFYTVAWSAGREPLEREIRKQAYDLDRLWMSAFGEPLKLHPEAKSYADRQRLLGHYEFADSVEKSLAARFAEVAA